MENRKYFSVSIEFISSGAKKLMRILDIYYQNNLGFGDHFSFVVELSSLILHVWGITENGGTWLGMLRHVR